MDVSISLPLDRMAKYTLMAITLEGNSDMALLKILLFLKSLNLCPRNSSLQFLARIITPYFQLGMNKRHMLVGEMTMGS